METLIGVPLDGTKTSQGWLTSSGDAVPSYVVDQLYDSSTQQIILQYNANIMGYRLTATWNTVHYFTFCEKPARTGGSLTQLLEQCIF